MADPHVTVVLATTGSRPDLLREAMGSIAIQEGVGVDCIVIADGVGEAEFDRVVEACKGRNVRVLRSARRRGLARSLNIAIRLAKAPYVARMDDDDICLPNRFARQVALMRSNDLDVCGTDALVIDESGKATGAYLKSNRFQRFVSGYQAVFGTLLLHPTVMMRTSWARANKYDGAWGRGQDRELWVRTIRTARFGVVPEPYLLYRRPSIVKQVQLDNVAAAFRLMARHWRIIGPLLPCFVALNMLRYFYYAGRFRLSSTQRVN